MANKTAVEFLIEHLFELKNPTLNQIEIMNQAKEMEKIHIMTSYAAGYVNGTESMMDDDFHLHVQSPEGYYNETFKSE